MYLLWQRPYYHLAGWLKACIGDLCYSKLFMVGLLSRDDRGVRGQKEGNVGIGHQVGLEFGHTNIQSSIKPEGSRLIWLIRQLRLV